MARLISWLVVGLTFVGAGWTAGTLHWVAVTEDAGRSGYEGISRLNAEAGGKAGWKRENLTILGGWLAQSRFFAWSVLWTRTPRLKQFMRELAD